MQLSSGLKESSAEAHIVPVFAELAERFPALQDDRSDERVKRLADFRIASLFALDQHYFRAWRLITLEIRIDQFRTLGGIPTIRSNGIGHKLGIKAIVPRHLIANKTGTNLTNLVPNVRANFTIVRVQRCSALKTKVRVFGEFFATL